MDAFHNPVRTNNAAAQTLPRDPKDIIFCARLINSYYPGLPEQVAELSQKHIFRHLDNLRGAFPDFNQLKGLRIIDLASGSRNWGGNLSHEFDPWMSRILHELGAIPLALDLCPQENERFESKVVDLSYLNALSFLKSSSFDSYYVDAFPTDTYLTLIYEWGRSWSEMKTNILSHLDRSVVKGARVIQGFTESGEAFAQGVIRRKFLDVNDAEL